MLPFCGTVHIPDIYIYVYVYPHTCIHVLHRLYIYIYINIVIFTCTAYTIILYYWQVASGKQVSAMVDGSAATWRCGSGGTTGGDASISCMAEVI